MDTSPVGCCRVLVLLLIGGLAEARAGQTALVPSAPPRLQSSPNRRALERSWWFEQRALPLGYIPADAQLRALQQSVGAGTPLHPRPLDVGPGPHWVNIGPAPIADIVDDAQPSAGRVTCIAVDPGNNAHWLIGSAQGGIWETRNSGVNWTPKTDDQPSLAIGALAFAPGNPAILYAGTGEGNFGSADNYAGAGLLKSTDGGSTWQLVTALPSGTFLGKSFCSIIVSPANANVLLGAIMPGLAGRGSEVPPFQPGFGIYKSSDGGANWVQKLAAFSTDLKADPGNFNHQLATGGSQPSYPGDFVLYRSMDAGETWNAISGPWTAPSGVGRMQIAVSPSNPNTVYVSVADYNNAQGNNNFNKLLGIWRTDNAWATTPTWTALPRPYNVQDQLWYNHALSVDPANANTLFFGEAALWKYNGTTWTSLGANYDAQPLRIHPDQHALAWAGGRLIVGNDGGVWSTQDGGTTFSNHNTNDLSLTQFYYGAVHPQTRPFALGGSQDNSCEKWLGNNAWTSESSGDGAGVAVSPVKPDENWVVEMNFLTITRVTQGGQARDIVFSAQAYQVPNAPLIGVVALAPGNEDFLLTAAGFLIKTTNLFSKATPNWFVDSPDLRNITAIAFAPSDQAGRIFAFGTDSGQVWVTKTGTGFDALNINGGLTLPNRYVTSLAFQPNNPNVLYVGLSGFDEGTPGKPGHVFKCGNALGTGATWVNISPPANLPCNALVIDPGTVSTVYAGTDIGVWKSSDGGGSWTHMGPETGLPNVAVFDLKIQAGTGKVFAFTHGRGAFMLDPNAINVPPTITTFLPTSGAPGVSVTITGTKFDNATDVRFGGTRAAGFVVNSSTQITATVPPGALTGPLAVTTPTGTGTSTSSFTVIAGPAITAFTPQGGVTGTQVTITGVNFTGATNVSFNRVAAPGATVNSPTQITATVPAGATTGKLSVSTPLGTAQSDGVFTVTNTPFISGFTPASGAVGASVTISGANFVNVTKVAFNGVAAANPAVTSTQIVATVPPAASTGPIGVTTANGSVQSATSFIVIPPPIINGFSPASGSADLIVKITGANLIGATAVRFNGRDAAAFTINSDAQITAMVPSGVTTGSIQVTTPGGIASSATAFTVLPPPANDNFSSSQLLSGPSGSVSGNNIAATKEPGEPEHAGDEGGKSLWYRWVAPSSSSWTFDTRGSTFDTLLAAYTGTSVNGLLEVASNDNIPGTNTSSLTFTATAGTTYFIAVDGFKGDAGELSEPVPTAAGPVVLNWNPSANLAPQIFGFSPTTANVGATVLISGLNLTNASGVKFNGASATFSVNSDFQITATVPVGASSGPIQVIKGSVTATSTASFIVRIAPPNDNFANAQPLSGNSGTITINTQGAGKEAGEPNHAGDPGGASVWYIWTAPANGGWRFDTAGSALDTILAIYTGSGLTTLSLVASNDNAAAGVFTSGVSFDATANTTYLIAVDGQGGAAGNVVLNWAFTGNSPTITGFSPAAGGPGTLVTITGANLGAAFAVKFGGAGAPVFTASVGQITATVPATASTGPITVTTPTGTVQSTNSFLIVAGLAPNDNFANRSSISAGSTTVTGSNVGATKEAGERNHAGNVGGASVWWTWKAPDSGSYAVSTRGGSFDTILGIYTGAAVGQLALVADNDDGNGMGTSSLASFTATAGVDYQIAVDGYNGASGDIILSIYPNTPGQLIYSTGFETSEGYLTNAASLAGQGAWVSQGQGANWVVYNVFGGHGQQAALGGFNSFVGVNNTYLWHPLNYTPNTNTLPVVKFSTYLAIVDSLNGFYDDFGWGFYNRSGELLFFLDFDNSNLGIYFQLSDGTTYYSGQDFANGYIYHLEVNLDFARNRWNASFNGASLVQAAPISATASRTLDLGDIDATWLTGYGDNIMFWDDYFVAAEPSQLPRLVTAPRDQSLTVGGNALFLVVVDTDLPVTYQWRFNGIDIAGASNPSLRLNNLTFAQAGAYSVIVSNSAGVVVAGPATLQVTDLPNLALYIPQGWSDKLVVATNLDSVTDATVISSAQDLYVNWAVANTSASGDVLPRFYTQLYVDGLLSQTWPIDALAAGQQSTLKNYLLGKLPAGTHSLRLETDATDVVPETDRSDNSYSKSVVVSAGGNPAPRLISASISAGLFQLTISGLTGRNYEIQASTNLTNWQVLATLTDTNADGLLPFSEPTAPGSKSRFYRARLVGP